METDEQRRKREEAEREAWQAIQAMHLAPPPSPLPAPITPQLTKAEKSRENVTQEARQRAEKVDQWQRADPTRGNR